MKNVEGRRRKLLELAQQVGTELIFYKSFVKERGGADVWSRWTTMKNILYNRHASMLKYDAIRKHNELLEDLARDVANTMSYYESVSSREIADALRDACEQYGIQFVERRNIHGNAKSST